MVEQYGIDLIVIGNGTASRESEKVVADFIKKNNLKVQYVITSEAGASVYSASQLAQDEYPNLDVTIRGAISIAHRVQDPLAELTKIDPKAIGVGQYQHDVDQKFLKEKLNEKVEDVVNAVGVDVNTASYTLLQYIAGLSASVAKNVVAYRDENGSFTDKKQIKKVKGLGPKAYEQAVGFLRIKEGKEPLDATGIHPDHYAATLSFLEGELGIKKKNLILTVDYATRDRRDQLTKTIDEKLVEEFIPEQEICVEKTQFSSIPEKMIIQTRLFIRPGIPFLLTDELITNFHLPKSSLMILISAFIGRKNLLEAYQRAIQAGYKFYSF